MKYSISITGVKDYCIGLNDGSRHRPLISRTEYDGEDYSQYFAGWQSGKVLIESK
jgi:hypothetical protein